MKSTLLPTDACGKRVNIYQGNRELVSFGGTAETTEYNQAFNVTFIKKLINDGAQSIAFSRDMSLDSDSQPQGLAMACRLLGDLWTIFVDHCAMGTGTHTTADVVNNDPTALAAETLAAMMATANSLYTHYNAHDVETGTYHPAAGTAHQASSASATTLVTLITRINDIRTQLIAHLADAAAHTAADTTNVITVAAAASGLVIKTAEHLDDIPCECSVLYFRSASGSIAFRAWGLK